jgi:hypothetical protein
LAMRARIVLAAADGLGNTAVAAKVGVEVGTARKWRARFLAQRLEGLLDEPRPGRPRTITDDQVEAVITRTLETTPRDATSSIDRRSLLARPHREDLLRVTGAPMSVPRQACHGSAACSVLAPRSSRRSGRDRASAALGASAPASRPG